MIADLVRKSRCCRRFYQDEAVSPETLRALVNLARLAPSEMNLQPLKYVLSCDPHKNALIFPCLGWAGYLKDWSGPPEGERPAAYILILGDTQLRPVFGIDPGIAAQTMLLGAAELGLGGCIIGSIQRPVLSEALQIPERYPILFAVALGKPKETVQIEEIGPAGETKYWRDAEGVHHVPKRALEEILLPY